MKHTHFCLLSILYRALSTTRLLTHDGYLNLLHVIICYKHQNDDDDGDDDDDNDYDDDDDDYHDDDDDDDCKRQQR